MDLTERAVWLPPLLALAAVAAVYGAIALWRRLRQRQDEVESAIGLQLLHGLKWRELAHLLRQALRPRGYEPADEERAPGEGGFDLLMQRGTERYLVQCKHGGSYTIGAAAVRELLGLLEDQEAGGAILVTTGRFDAEAHAVARNRPVQLFEGVTLWRELRPFVDQAVLDAVARGSAARRDRQRLLHVVAAVVAGLVVYAAAAWWMGSGKPAATNGRAAVISAPARPAATPADAVGPRAAPAAAPALAPAAARGAEPAAAPEAATQAAAARRPAAARPPELSEAEAQSRRDAAVAAARAIPGVVGVDWATRSTLGVTLEAGNDARLDALVAEVCTAILAYEELRYTRLQVTDVAAEGAAATRVHWRQCN
ncbi:MAG TPA: restriction endonuclease [Rhodanobacteraceae bacterium]|nr:restriction endonuclease [Rhodanobacteraceae bacterium]